MKAKKRREEKNGTRGSAGVKHVSHLFKCHRKEAAKKHGCVNPAAEETSRLMSPSRL